LVYRLLSAVFVALLFGYLTHQAWTFLRDTDASKTALIAETESYAARSQFIRDIEALLQALRSVKAYWTTYGRLPRDQWAGDAGVELELFDGIDSVLWYDSTHDIRYLRTAQNPVLDYRPDDEVWRNFEALLKIARPSQTEAILPPYAGETGRTFHVIIDDSDNGGGLLIAVINAQRALEHLLRDQSPGYAISVLWNNEVLYRRGRPAPNVPSNWTREGRIRTSMGAAWTIVHTPTLALADSLATPTIDAVLPLGFTIALLLASLIFENGRARLRAVAAENAERRIAQLNKTLEQDVAERTEELANRTSDLETIADSVAHDLRNPLNAISVNTQVLEQQFGPALGQEGLNALHRTASGVRRMSEILDRLVGLSIAAHSTFQREPLHMKSIVAQVFEELQIAEPLPLVEFELGDLPDVDADETLVRTLVLNLLSNAMKYTRGKDHRRIEVTSSTVDGITTYCVRDNGVGFDLQHADRMFQAFQQLPGTQQSEGMGLGLMIVARIVKRHSGLIWAEGVTGQEAAFYFTLQHKCEIVRR
jgi:signal transduction histidine kinase